MSHRRSDQPPTLAEALIDLADATSYPRTGIFVCQAMDEWRFSRVKLALKFVQLPKGTQLRAIWEGWPLERIVREVY